MRPPERCDRGSTSRCRRTSRKGQNRPRESAGRKTRPSPNSGWRRSAEKVQAARIRLDKRIVNGFLDDARAIFEAAESASRSGAGVSDFTMLIGHDGAIQMLAASDWPLDRLLEERGARAAYRVGELNGRVVVEARSGSQACKLESESPRAVARRILGFSSVPLRAGNSLLLPAMSD